MSERPRWPVPRKYARYYLEATPSLVWLLCGNVLAVLVGVRYYVETMVDVSTFLWPLYADSPAAVFLMALSVATLLPNLGRPLADVPRNRALAYLHTLAFVWLLKTGLWTAVVLHLGFDAYFPAPWAYFGILLTHLAFVWEAFLIPHYGSTTRGALAFALFVALANDLLDYGFGYHPPIRIAPSPALVVATLAVSLGSVALASYYFDRLSSESGR
ncbi:DUF1405 domain-containing protein [Haloarculaceae archaeon H-GB2-1]|nr:DUF1405 domain-containing protein [Haloarculaceae archaeon H-GB1-1]MEA5385948.1 DUF1405 domain-containing protein [Haloarculaceae archaeon H-GB11]MEA5407454.1 DUF1405 domain-containing protein [Haloarculaceae archaeon H-GB2-1]